MKKIKTTIIINASVEKVWNVLMDFPNYTNWNPFINSIEGTAKVGNILTITMNLEGQKPQVFTPTIKELTKNKAFCWVGKLSLNMFTGEHYFELVPLEENKTKLVHGENFKGWLVWLIMLMIGEKTKNGFIQMNEGLKKEAEK